MLLTRIRSPFTASFRYDRAIDGINNKSVIDRKADQKILLHIIIGTTVNGQCSACERCFDIADNIADVPEVFSVPIISIDIVYSEVIFTDGRMERTVAEIAVFRQQNNHILDYEYRQYFIRGIDGMHMR